MGYQVRFDTLCEIFLRACVDINQHIKFKNRRPNSSYHTGLVTPILILHCYAENLYERYGSIGGVVTEIRNTIPTIPNPREEEEKRIQKIFSDLRNRLQNHQYQSQDNSSGKILTVRDAYTGGHRSHLKGCELDYDLIGNENTWNPIIHINLTRDMLIIGESLNDELAIFRVGCYIFPVNEQGILGETRIYRDFLTHFGNRRRCTGQAMNNPSEPCVGGSLHLGACKSSWVDPNHRYGPSRRRQHRYLRGQRKVFFGRNPGQARLLSHRLVSNIKKYPGLLSREEINNVAETVKRRLNRIDSIRFAVTRRNGVEFEKEPRYICLSQEPLFVCQDPTEEEASLCQDP